MNIPVPPPVATNTKPAKPKKTAQVPPSVENSTVQAPTADMVSISKADLEALLNSAAQKGAQQALLTADPKAMKEAKKAQAKVDRKAANKARGDEALTRCMNGGKNSEEFVKAVFREAYAAAKGLSGEEFKATYNAVCIAKLGVPRYVAKAA